MTAKKVEKLNGEIRPGERQQLVRLVKMKTDDVLAEIEDQFAQQMADIEKEVARRFQDEDARLHDFKEELAELVQAANEKAAELFGRFSDLVETRSRSDYFNTPFYNQRDARRSEARRALVATVHARRQRARQLATANRTRLIEELTLGALESEAAKAFVGRMPTAEELMSTERTAINGR